jgi:hypothetical protein
LVTVSCSSQIKILTNNNPIKVWII